MKHLLYIGHCSKCFSCINSFTPQMWLWEGWYCAFHFVMRKLRYREVNQLASGYILVSSRARITAQAGWSRACILTSLLGCLLMGTAVSDGSVSVCRGGLGETMKASCGQESAWLLPLTQGWKEQWAASWARILNLFHPWGESHHGTTSYHFPVNGSIQSRAAHTAPVAATVPGTK